MENQEMVNQVTETATNAAVNTAEIITQEAAKQPSLLKQFGILGATMAIGIAAWEGGKWVGKKLRKMADERKAGKANKKAKKEAKKEESKQPEPEEMDPRDIDTEIE